MSRRMGSNIKKHYFSYCSRYRTIHFIASYQMVIVRAVHFQKCSHVKVDYMDQTIRSQQ